MGDVISVIVRPLEFSPYGSLQEEIRASLQERQAALGMPVEKKSYAHTYSSFSFLHLLSGYAAAILSEIPARPKMQSDHALFPMWPSTGQSAAPNVTI